MGRRWQSGPRGPWGQGGGNGGPTPPNLEDLLRKGQEKLKRSMPGGSGGFNILGLAIGALVLIWLVSTSIFVLEADEVGVLTRFGLQPPGGAGREFQAALPIEQVTVVKETVENSIDIGGDGGETLFLTGDRNIIDIAYTVRWRITPAAPTSSSIR
ncbi:protease modulator HflK N-terminal domain-containing protein [Hankyongella ginsenosidimutans]|uniref:protease modulator HflK N-terminal domain-containing protein n=1 Tax=Hankyongella ginsenosidimutans TaxID=1763828 RepID=UPI001FE3392D|nr:protease modulator HflK N-terminal domain-containing protein [Hankyongella ginsenosidimutans]